MDDDVISLHSDQSDNQEHVSRRDILESVVRHVVDALGGCEGGVYRMGDEVNGCLRDLKKLWRKDDTDDERTVARIFWETRVLPNDLIPILLATAGKGQVEDKRAIACADLVTAMTWPIDVASELRELDEELDKGTDYTQLMLSHLNYKAVLLKPGVMQALFGIMLPPLSKPAKERQERDGQIVNVVLHLIRNLAFIKDLPPNMHLSADQAEYSSLQTKLVKALSETHTLDLLLTIAANNDQDPLFNASNTLVLEIFYLLFRGIKPTALAIDQTKQPAQNLQRLLAAEDKKKRDIARNASSRHSRFGTTIAVRLNTNKKAQVDRGGDNAGSSATADASERGSSSRPLVLHRQAAITQESGNILDISKHQKARKANKVDELTRDDNLSYEARLVLQGFAKEFVESCFNPFLSSLLKDIKSERPKITEKDHLRLSYTTKWLLEFFLDLRSKENVIGGHRRWNLGLVAGVTDRSWIIWVLRRMREAMEEKPKMWNELQAGIECLTQLLLLIDNMASSVISDPELNEAAQLLQQQLIYNGDVLDIALESLRSYKEGTQSLTYLNSSVYLAYELLRMLERWGKENSSAMYVRKKAIRKKKAQGNGPSEEDGVPNIEDEGDTEEEEDIIHETMFTFEAFEMKFAHSEITRTLLFYLSRYKEFDSPELMKRAVNLIHRQVVKAKAEALYFNVSTLQLFKSILDDQRSLPKDTSYKDLVQLITFISRKFFKAVKEEPFLMIEAWYPMNRGHWKQYSSWEPEQKANRTRESAEDSGGFSGEVQVKKGYSWSEQIGIAVAALIEDGKSELVEWVKDILVLVIRQRQQIIHETDQNDRDGDADEIEDVPRKNAAPSKEALSKLTDYEIPYINDKHAEAATKDARLKLVFRLLEFTIVAEDAEELQWVVPASIAPSVLRERLHVVDQFLKNPIDLEGKKASEMLSKKTRRRHRRRSPSLGSDVELPDDEPRRRKKEKKRKEEKTYKSAQFIGESDEEYGDMEAFLEREKALREKTARAAAESGKIATMRATGTKKRRKKGKDAALSSAEEHDLIPVSPKVFSDDSNSDDEIIKSLRRSRSPSPPLKATARPKPKPRLLRKPKPAAETINISSDSEQQAQARESPTSAVLRPARKGRVVLSDDEV
ncbi:timeless protein-domain-containing protein [Boletus reticuloceps]|uniref:Timeless protein-domain-containing protein n=1 Tax=Boletus reticuloceps TaxID=495285 RepID=A0A8I3ACI6_9AGAM|nr:timeless protein-domain-containing protein [Boletus reticuloceps]